MNPFINQIASKEMVELMSRFFDAASEAVKRSEYNDESLEAFDLIQAISCYRYFPAVEQCIEAFPSLSKERYNVEYIWNQFNTLSEEELSDVFINSLSKLDLKDCLMK